MAGEVVKLLQINDITKFKLFVCRKPPTFAAARCPLRAAKKPSLRRQEGISAA